MKLRRSNQQYFVLEVSETELDAMQAGLRETLEALSDWEFQTRTGLERQEMSSILSDLITARKNVGEAPSDA